MAAGFQAGCQSAPPGSAQSGGTIRASLRGEPKSFNRLVVARAAEELLSRLTHAPLVRVHRVTNELEPWLARDWTMSDDGRTWTLRLRSDVKFSDGMPFTSADVAFTFRALYDPKVASPLASSIGVNGQPIHVAAPDAHTVVLTFADRYGPGLRILDSLPMLPAHKLDGFLQRGTMADAWGPTTPPAELVGLGPFVVSDYRPGERIVLRRNPHYWRRDEQGVPLPYLDALELEIVGEQNAELLRLQQGTTDLTTSEVRPEDLAVLRPLVTKRRIQLVEAGVSAGPDGLWFNLTPGASSLKGRTWLQRTEFRLAVSHAVDRAAVVNTVYLGAAEPVWTSVTRSHGEWYVEDLARPSFDPARARDLLSAVGLVDRNGDGLLEDGAGQPARFSILTLKGHSLREKTVSVVQEQLRKVGLSADIVAVDQGVLIDTYGKRTYDAMYFSATADSVDPARNMDFWLSSGFFHYWNPLQKSPATTWESRIDALMRQQATTLDAAERRRLFAEAQRMMAEEAPFITFAAPKVTIAMSGRVRGATPSVLMPQVLWNAERLWVAPAGEPGR